MTKRFDPSLLPLAPDLSIESQLWRAGIQYIAGIDEAGRGALAGPVAAGAVILPQGSTLLDTLRGLKDSKQLTPVQREVWAELLQQVACAWGVGYASQEEIDRIGIIPATRLAAQRAMDNFDLPVEHLLLDYLFLPEVHLPQTNLIKGDQRSLSIAGASVLAKTARDRLLVELDTQYPGYGFAAHKGYATAQHLAALDRLGPSPVHRVSFAPIKERMEL
jgi:ribonuclease HII